MLCSYSREDYISSFAKGSKKGALLYLLLYPFLYLVSSVISFRCVSRNSIGESSTTLHLIVRPQVGVSVEPDLLVADFGSQAEFTCKIYAQDDRPTPSKSCQSSHTVWKLILILQYCERSELCLLLFFGSIIHWNVRLFYGKASGKILFRQKLMKNASSSWIRRTLANEKWDYFGWFSNTGGE